jgi:hypothetical protein
MSDNLDALPGGRLLKLPAEIRLFIYEALFTPCKINIHATRKSSQKDLEGIHAKSNNAAILATCRIIYTEAKPILYDNTDFHVKLARDSADDASSDDLVSAQFPRRWTPGELMSAAGEHGINPLVSYLQEPLLPVFSLARKISLSIFFTNSNDQDWPYEHKNWYTHLPRKLSELSKAPELKQLHLTFEARTRPFLRRESNHVLGLLGEIKPRAAVTLTVALDASMCATDCLLAPYVETIAKLNW